MKLNEALSDKAAFYKGVKQPNSRYERILADVEQGKIEPLITNDEMDKLADEVISAQSI